MLARSGCTCTLQHSRFCYLCRCKMLTTDSGCSTGTIRHSPYGASSESQAMSPQSLIVDRSRGAGERCVSLAVPNTCGITPTTMGFASLSPSDLLPKDHHQVARPMSMATAYAERSMRRPRHITALRSSPSHTLLRALVRDPPAPPQASYSFSGGTRAPFLTSNHALDRTARRVISTPSFGGPHQNMISNSRYQRPSSNVSMST